MFQATGTADRASLLLCRTPGLPSRMSVDTIDSDPSLERMMTVASAVFENVTDLLGFPDSVIGTHWTLRGLLALRGSTCTMHQRVHLN